MKKRDIFLDFTSLLDVTLIIIFFFVIFTRIDVEEKFDQLKEEQQQVEAREEEANELVQQLEQEIELVRDASERQASNIKEIIQYEKSGNMKFVLVMQMDEWTINVNCKKETIAEIAANSDIEYEIINALKKAGYVETDTIFCDFVFDGSLPNTASAYRNITNAFESVKKKYKFLYCSETDLSIGKE